MSSLDQNRLLLSRFDADYLRGLAMLAIMLHNYFHLHDHAPGENEFSFSLAISLRFLENIWDSPQDIFRQAFSYLGHYGVQLFVFLSGYGLSMRYRDEDYAYGSFIAKRLYKFYPVLLLAVAGLFFYKAAVWLLTASQEIELGTFLQEALLKLTLLSNLVPGQALSISGPWWFFSLIFQLYLLAPLLLRIRQGSILVAVITGAWLLQMLVLRLAPQYTEYIRYNFPAHLPEFCLGILCANSLQQLNWKGWALLSIPVFVAGVFYDVAWVMAFTAVPLLAIALYKLLSPAESSFLSRLMLFFGKNSLYFFVIHGLCRPPFIVWGNQSIAWSLLAAVFYLLTVVVVAMVFKKLYLSLMGYFTKELLASRIRVP